MKKKTILLGVGLLSAFAFASCAGNSSGSHNIVNSSDNINSNADEKQKYVGIGMLCYYNYICASI